MSKIKQGLVQNSLVLHHETVFFAPQVNIYHSLIPGVSDIDYSSICSRRKMLLRIKEAAEQRRLFHDVKLKSFVPTLALF